MTIVGIGVACYAAIVWAVARRMFDRREAARAGAVP
jgi:hypothetical protein